MSIIDLPRVSECTVAGCSYNHDGCHASAVTVGEDAACATFIPLDLTGGLSKVVSKVGACHEASCIHNEKLECSASSIRMGSGKDAATCLSFEEA